MSCTIMPSSRSPLLDFTIPRGPPRSLWPLCATAAGAGSLNGNATVRTRAAAHRDGFTGFCIASSLFVSFVNPRAMSLQWLDANDPAVVIDVPDSHWIGGIVDPTFAVEPVRLRQHIFGETLGL